MSIWAIIPVKPFAAAKSRLASVLTPTEREALSRSFFEHVLGVLRQTAGIHRTLVISRDSGALTLARDYGAQTISESGPSSLNAALARATQVALLGRARAVLVLPADLPFLSVAEVHELIDDALTQPSVAIAPDRINEGTNALFIHPPGLLNYAFGLHSFIAHVTAAQAASAHLRVCRLPGITLDVDLPEDLAFYRAAKASS